MPDCISVVIPTYNASRFLRETLSSVFAQTRLPDEVIVVDDASTDGTPAIVRELTAGAPVPLRLIELAKNTGGPATPMNVGIDAARGEFIALLDHDDLMAPEKLAVQFAAFADRADVELALSDYEVRRGNEVEYEPKPWPWSSPGDNANSIAGCGPLPSFAPHTIAIGRARYRMFLVDGVTCTRMFIRSPGLPRSCSNMFFRKRLWARLQGFDRRAGQCSDYDFVIRAAGGPVAWIDARLFEKRTHDNNLWKANAGNLLKTLRAQRRSLEMGDGRDSLRLGVAIGGSSLARFARSRRQHLVSFGASLELLLLGYPHRAAAEAGMTLLLFPLHVAANAARAGKQLLDRGRRTTA
jgi:glycosyltransferase involved in cell wall biosynthesis